MANINLSSISYEDQKKEGFSQGALFGVFVFLILVLVVWGASYGIKMYLVKKINSTNAQFSAYNAQLFGEDAKKVIDFQRRLDVSKELVLKGRNVQDDMTQIESLMVPNSYLVSYSYSDTAKTVSLEFAADNFNTVAKQILSFKNSQYFSAVTAGESNVDSTTGKIVSSAELKIK